MTEYWYTLDILDLISGIKVYDSAIITAETEEKAFNQLVTWLDEVYPEDEFDVDIVLEDD